MIILKHKGWVIETDNNFPSTNYVLYNKDKDKYKAYCSSLESALKMLYDQMLLDNMQDDYKATIKELRETIIATKRQFNELLNIKPLTRLKSS